MDGVRLKCSRAGGRCDGSGVGIAAFESHLFVQKAGNDAVDHLQHRGVQLRMGGEHDAQRGTIAAFTAGITFSAINTIERQPS